MSDIAQEIDLSKACEAVRKLEEAWMYSDALGGPQIAGDELSGALNE